MTISLGVLKRGLVFFWAAWFTIVFLTNLFDLLKQLGIVAQDWAFASGNFGFMAATTSLYATPESVVLLLFIGVVVWEAVAAGLFWRAFAGYGSGVAGMGRINTAFAVGLALWAAFLVADELTMAYDVASTHMGLLTAQTVTLLALHLLPDGAKK
jgi:hypothetical protein